MTSQEFLANYFMPNYDLYILSVIICFLYSFFIFRKKVRSIIDPLLMAVVGWSFANSVAVFLILLNLVSKELVSYYLISVIIVSGAFYFFYPDRGKSMAKGKIEFDYKFNRYLFVVFLLLYLITTLYKYSINGIPLFNESRFAVNVDNASGILGMLGRLSNTCHLFNIMYCLFLINNRKRIQGATLLLILIMFSLLSGSKGFILRFCAAFFFYKVLFENKIPKIKIKYLIAVLLTPLVVIITAGLASSGLDSFIYYAYRVLAYGDIYWNAYPNNVINDVSFTSPIANMTYMFWGPFRHILGLEVSNEIMTTGGSLLFEENYGVFPDGGAPNSPITVMSWIYYRWSGILLIIIQASVIALFYKKYNHKRRTLFNAAVQGSIISTTFSFMGDIYLVFNGLFNVLLLIILYKIFCVLYNLTNKDYATKNISYNNSL